LNITNAVGQLGENCIISSNVHFTLVSYKILTRTYCQFAFLGLTNFPLTSSGQVLLSPMFIWNIKFQVNTTAPLHKQSV
jgi:hypothetical protein